MSDFLTQFLPSAPAAAAVQAPRKLIIYGGFKVGKTKLCEWLANNTRTLWIDCEDGSLFEQGWVSASGGMLLNVVSRLREANAKAPPGQEIGPTGFVFKILEELAKENPRRFDYIIVDKLDTLESWAERRATAYYKQTVIGKNFGGISVLELDKGGGYGYLRDQFNEIWSKLSAASPRLIMIASLRASQVDKVVATVSNADLDLTGKVRKIAAGDADAVGYLFRQPNGENWISFITDQRETFAGSRIPRLEGKQFKLTWRKADGTIDCDWKQLFPDAQIFVDTRAA
jgi:hypothetical protein